MWLTTQKGSTINTDLFIAVNVKDKMISGHFPNNPEPYEIATFDSPELAREVYKELVRALSSKVNKSDVSQMLHQKEEKAKRKAINLEREARERADRAAKTHAAEVEANEEPKK